MRLALSLGALAALQIVASLVGQLIVLRIVGVGPESDAYIAAQALPQMVLAVVAASLQGLWLPRFARLSQQPAELLGELATAQGQTFKILLLMTVPLWLSSRLWAAWAFPGFSAEQLGAVVSLSGPLFAGVLLNAQSGILTAGMRAKGRFIPAELVSLAGSVLSIAAYAALVPQHGIMAAAWIGAARALLVYAVQLFQAGRPGVAWRATEASRTVWRQVRPLLGAAMIIKSTPVVDRYWSSQAASGAVTVLHMAQLGINALAAVFERAILVPVSPEFARRLAKRDIAGLRKAYHRCLARSAIAVSALALALLALRPFWDPLLLFALRVPALEAQQVYLACLLLLPSLFAAVGASSAAAVFYAFGETRLPTLIGITGFAASLALKALLFRVFGLLGIAAGTSLYVLTVLGMYHVAVNRRLRLELRS